MKLYDENNEMNAGNEAEQNSIPAPNNTEFTEETRRTDNTATSNETTPTAQVSETEPTYTAQAMQDNANESALSQATQQIPQQNTYAYSRDNIPDNTYRATPQQNPYYNPTSYTNNPQTGYQTNGQQGQNQNYNPYGQSSSQQPTQQNPAQNGGQQNGYTPYQQSYHQYNGQQSYQNPQQNSPYGQQTNQPYGRESYNPYAGGTGYNSMQNGDRISYEPDKKAIKKKKKGSGKKAAVAVACVCGLCLSTGFGFLGAVIANRMFPSAPQEEIVVDTEGNVVSETTGTAVFYKSVENLATSTTGNGGDLTMAQVSALVEDTVVEITTEYLNKSAWFQYVSTGAGSGVILSEDGYIITNNHVICGSDGITPADTITVRLTNGEEYKAELIGTDSDSDIAILKIEATGLTPAICGNSDTLVVGETVLAVGNPLGELGGTQTDGIISALDREIDVNGVTMTLLQTSAAVNPGNSGGALFNMRGELIGVVNAKSSGTGIEGLGFAIPVNDALHVSEQLMEFGYVRGKVTIGVSFYDVQDALEARYYGLPGYGLYVTSLTEGMNDTTLKVKDRIISIDGKEIGSFNDVSTIVKSHKVGDVLKFQISRDGEIMEVDVTCYEKVPAGFGEVEFQEKQEKQG